MKKRKNRRTLKKRIGRAMSFSAFTTVLFISGILILIVLSVSKVIVAFQLEAVSTSIQREINSGNAIKTLGINSFDEFDIDNPKTQIWLDEINQSTIMDDFNIYNKKTRFIFINIEINDKLVYSNEVAVDSDNTDDLDNAIVDDTNVTEVDTVHHLDNTHIKEVSKFYGDNAVVKPILDMNDKQIGNIIVKMNPEITFGIVGLILATIIVLSIGALIIAKILSKILMIPILNPLKQLEKKVKAIADGDQETAANTQVILKRPLREIEALADSTNGIMKKLNKNNEMLEDQKRVLENQNDELEMQNEELIESKLQIQNQQAKLIQSEKMASVGLLTAAITHEINTPIGAINSNVQIEEMLCNEMANHPLIQSSEELNTIFTQLKEVNGVNLMACSRIIEIIKSLKSFSRLDEAEFQEANINEGIKSVLVLTNNLLKNRITVHEEYGDIPFVKCFPGQLNQVLMNIIVNASQAIEGEGEIFIQTNQMERHICITIRDTGTGIKEEDIIKIFDPEFTTKGVGVGLGLGLYISYNIIQNHHGEISVESEIGKGTVFHIKIPIDNQNTFNKNTNY